MDKSTICKSSRIWCVYDSVVITEEDAEKMTRIHYPDHEIVDFKTEDYLYAGGGFKAMWLSKTKEM